MVSAFWAGAIQSFGKGFKEDYDQRKEQYQKYVDTGIETAKLMRPKIEEQRAKRDRLLGLQREWEKKYGIDGNTFSLLASKMDLDTLNQSLTTASQTLANNGQELDAEYVKRMFDLPDQVTLPDGMTPEAAIDKAMGFYTSNLLSEKNPKSEGAKTRAGGKSIAQLIFMNPRAKADEALKGMNYAGYNVNDLVNYSMSGAGRKDIFTDTTIDTAGAGVTFDYDSSKDHARTTTYIRRAFSDKIFGVEDIAEVSAADLTPTTLAGMDVSTDADKRKEQAEIVKRNVNMSARLLADLEEEMVFDSRYSIPAGLRSRILGDIVDSVDNMEEFQTLSSSIKSGKAAEYIINKVQAGEPLTGEDYDKIILNNFESKDEDTTITGGSGSDNLESATGIDALEAGTSPDTVVIGDGTVSTELTLAQRKAKEAAERAGGGTGSEVTGSDKSGLPGFRERDNVSTVYDPLASSVEAGQKALTTALSAGGATREYLSGMLTESASSLREMDAAFTAGAAKAYAFLSGLTGSESLLSGAKSLQNASERNKEQAAEIAATGFLEYLDDTFAGEKEPADDKVKEEIKERLLMPIPDDMLDEKSARGTGKVSYLSGLIDPTVFKSVKRNEEAAEEPYNPRAIGTVGSQDLGLREDVRDRPAPSVDTDSPSELDVPTASQVSAVVGTGADRRPNNVGLMSPGLRRLDKEQRPVVQEGLETLVDTGVKVHGTKSKTAQLLKKVSDQASRGARVKPADITKLISETSKLPQTDTRDTLLMQLYELRDTLNKR